MGKGTERMTWICKSQNILSLEWNLFGVSQLEVTHTNRDIPHSESKGTRRNESVLPLFRRCFFYSSPFCSSNNLPWLSAALSAFSLCLVLFVKRAYVWEVKGKVNCVCVCVREMERHTLSRASLFLAFLWAATEHRVTAKTQTTVCVFDCVGSSPLAAHYKFQTGVAATLCRRLFNYCFALCVRAFCVWARVDSLYRANHLQRFWALKLCTASPCKQSRDKCDYVPKNCPLGNVAMSAIERSPSPEPL